jgi:hypothetical protein
MYAFNDSGDALYADPPPTDSEDDLRERFYCKNPFSNLCVTKKGIVKYNRKDFELFGPFELP